MLCSAPGVPWNTATPSAALIGVMPIRAPMGGGGSSPLLIPARKSLPLRPASASRPATPGGASLLLSATASSVQACWASVMVWLLGYACSYTIPGTGACRLSPVFHTPHSNYGDRRRAPVPLETQPYASNQRPPRQRHNILQHRRRRAHILIEHILQQGKIRHIVGADFLRVRQVRIELGVGVGGGGFVGGEAVLAQGV